MIVLETLFFYFISYAIISALDFTISRRTSLRVNTLIESRYFLKQINVAVRNYIISLATLWEKLISFGILSAQLVIFYNLYLSQVYEKGTNVLITGFCFYLLILLPLLLPIDSEKKKIKLYDNQFLLISAFYLLLIFIPQYAINTQATIYTFFILTALIIGSAFLYFATNYFRYVLNIAHKNLFITMQIFLSLNYIIVELFWFINEGFLKFLIGFIFTILLTTAILILHNLSSSNKNKEITLKQSYSLIALSLMMLSLLGGGLLL